MSTTAFSKLFLADLSPWDASLNPSGYPGFFFFFQLCFPEPDSPLGGGGGCGIHGKVPDGALLHVLLLPLGHVGLQGQDPLLLLPHEFHEGRGIVFWQAGWLAISVFLEKWKT